MEYYSGEQLNPVEFYNYTKLITPTVKMRTALMAARERGLKTPDGKLIRLAGYTRHDRTDAWEIAKYQPVILTIDTERGEDFVKRQDSEGVLHRRFEGFHAVIGMETIDGVLWCTNSWGPTWGRLKNGTFGIRKTIQNKVRPFIYEVYSLTLES
jgi:hypothetical protein